MMNGYQIETNVLCDLIGKQGGQLNIPSKMLQTMVQMIAPKWLIPIFFDTVDVWVTKQNDDLF